MRRKHEIVNGRPISCWACSDKYEFAGRYTVVYLDTRDERGQVQYLGMNARPLHPQGFGMHGEMPIRNVAYRGRGGVFDERIQFKELPPDCQRAVLQDLELPPDCQRAVLQDLELPPECQRAVLQGLEPEKEDTRASVHPLQDIMDAINTQDNRGTSHPMFCVQEKFCGWTGDFEDGHWETITVCFTQRGAEEYIKTHRHHLGETRIYIESYYWNAEMIRIRDWLMSQGNKVS